MRCKNKIRQSYKGYDKALKPYKTEMIQAMKENKALAVAIIETYRAGSYRSHYWKTIGYFGRNHNKAYKGFCDTGLSLKVLCGRDEFWLTLQWCGYTEIFKKYYKSIPEQKAFGLIYKVAIDVINGRIK